jgi:A/G-specific adenine glycosylase
MSAFVENLINWYEENHRQLPWRETHDPYCIWVSEIILQQTRIAQGLPYYERFIRNFPDIQSLAGAEEDELLKLWEGLGYYSRARNMHEAAKTVMHRHGGVFPSDYSDIRNLKGVGEYTAAAIASIAFGQRYAVTDGNVLRVLARFYGISTPIDTSSGRKLFSKVATELVPETRAGTYNQAVMELGALVCTPRNPACGQCPLACSCFSYASGNVTGLPVKKKAKLKSKLYFTFLLMESDSHILIEKRTANGIWKNLYQLPLTETDTEPADEDIIKWSLIRNFLAWEGSLLKGISPVVTHELTHRTICARFIHVYNNDLKFPDDKFLQVSKQEIYKFAFPVLIKNFLVENKFL